jgi:hypothetical protein
MFPQICKILSGSGRYAKQAIKLFLKLIYLEMEPSRYADIIKNLTAAANHVNEVPLHSGSSHAWCCRA